MRIVYELVPGGAKRSDAILNDPPPLFILVLIASTLTQGVKRSASQSEIKKAWRKLSLDLHPDKNNRCVYMNLPWRFASLEGRT